MYLIWQDHYSGAKVRFSEFDIAEACWPILFKFYVYRQKGSGQLTTIWGHFEQIWISIENDSSKLTKDDSFYRTLKKIIRHELAYAHSDQGLLFFV